MAMPSELVLVRHGQSEANVIQKMFKENPDAEAPEGFFDRHDSEMRLSEKGIEQAQATGAWLLEHFPDGFDRYIVSPHVRTVETAENMAVDGDWIIDDRWRERDWGEYGVVNEVIREQVYGISKQLKEQNKWYWCPPGGESLATGVRLRFEDVLDTLHREAEGERVLVVTHGEMIDVARFVLERLTPIEWLAQDKDEAYNIGNCQIVHFSRTDPMTQERAPKMLWRRSLNPFNPDYDWNDGGWSSITHRRYSDADLAGQVALFPPMLRQETPAIEATQVIGELPA